MDSGAGESFLLRMYIPPLRGEDALRSELLWLEALGREARVPVPAPVPADDGSLTRHISAQTLPERLLRALARRLSERFETRGKEVAPSHWLCALQRWMPGTHRRKGLTLDDLTLLGSYIARLHNHAEQYQVPDGFARPRWGWEWVFGDGAPLWSRGEFFYSTSEMDVFRATADLVRRDLETLGESRDVFGLIHRDLTLTNLVFREGDACAVDFDSCGWGHYLLDLAVALLPLEAYRGRSSALQSALLEGYQRECPLLSSYREYLKTFTAMRIAARVNQHLLTLDRDGRARKLDASSPLLSNSVERLREFASG